MGEWKRQLNAGILTRVGIVPDDLEGGPEMVWMEEESGTAPHKALSVTQSESFGPLSTLSTETGSMTTPTNTLSPLDSVFNFGDPLEELYNTPASAHTGGERNVRPIVNSADDE